MKQTAPLQTLIFLFAVSAAGCALGDLGYQAEIGDFEDNDFDLSDEPDDEGIVQLSGPGLAAECPYGGIVIYERQRFNRDRSGNYIKGAKKKTLCKKASNFDGFFAYSDLRRVKSKDGSNWNNRIRSYRTFRPKSAWGNETDWWWGNFMTVRLYDRTRYRGVYYPGDDVKVGRVDPIASSLVVWGGGEVVNVKSVLDYIKREQLWGYRWSEGSLEPCHVRAGRELVCIE